MDCQILHVCLNLSPRIGTKRILNMSVFSYNLLLHLLKSEMVNEILSTIILHGVHAIMWLVPCIYRFVAHIVFFINMYCLMKAFRFAS
jgi:hypothetical protein